RISNKLSLDGGYFLTNKGNEIFSQENLLFNSLTMNNYVMPISVAGLRINYKIKQFSFSTMLLNSMEDRNSRSGNFAIGIDIKYLDSIFDVNYNGIYGREEYTGFELFRMYNNLSIVAEILKDLKVGMEL